MDEQTTEQTDQTGENASTELSPLEQAAEKLLRDRIQHVRALEDAAARTRRLREDLKKAEQDEGDAWKTATDAGWTRAELRQLGLTPPTSKRGGRTSNSRRKGPTPATQD